MYLFSRFPQLCTFSGDYHSNVPFYWCTEIFKPDDVRDSPQARQHRWSFSRPPKICKQQHPWSKGSQGHILWRRRLWNLWGVYIGRIFDLWGISLWGIYFRNCESHVAPCYFWGVCCNWHVAEGVGLYRVIWFTYSSRNFSYKEKVSYPHSRFYCRCSIVCTRWSRSTWTVCRRAWWRSSRMRCVLHMICSLSLVCLYPLPESYQTGVAGKWHS